MDSITTVSTDGNIEATEQITENSRQEFEYTRVWLQILHALQISSLFQKKKKMSNFKIIVKLAKINRLPQFKKQLNDLRKYLYFSSISKFCFRKN